MSPAAGGAPAYVSCPRCAQVVAKPAVGNPTCPACGYPGPDRRTAAPAAPAWTPNPGAAPVQYDQFGRPVAAAPVGTGMSTAGLVCGLIGLLLPIVGIVGIILAAIAKSKGQPKAKTALIVAIVCTVVGLVLGILLQVYVARVLSN